MVVVLETHFVSYDAPAVCVRLTAGEQQVSTEVTSSGKYYQPFALLVEQGTESIECELLDGPTCSPLATLSLDPKADILDPLKKGVVISGKTFVLNSMSKRCMNPQVKLTIQADEGDEEDGFLAGRPGISLETKFMLREQLRGVQREVNGYSLTNLELFARGCKGPVLVYGAWGSKKEVFLAVKGPPFHRKYTLSIWKSKKDWEAKVAVSQDVSLLKVLTVQRDPNRQDVFIICYEDKKNIRSKLTLQRLDRSRDVWVEMLSIIIAEVRGQRAEQKGISSQGKV